jgi:hypothetical protein
MVMVVTPISLSSLVLLMSWAFARVLLAALAALGTNA